MIITTHCNQQCPFCYVGRTVKPAHKPLEWISIELGRARKLCDGNSVILSGGETTLHPRILDVMDVANSLGFSKIALFTNGQRLRNRNFVEDLVRHGLHDAMISLHGSRADVHDQLVGKQHFADVLEGIKTTLNAGVRVIVNTVATTSNLSDVGSIYHLIQDRFPNVLSYRISYPVSSGKLLEHPELLPSYEDIINRIYSILRGLKGVPLATDLIPLCLLGAKAGIAIEYQQTKDDILFIPGIARYHRIAGKPCLQCRHKDICCGLQFNSVVRHGVPGSYGKPP